MAQEYSQNYYAVLARERRALEKRIYQYHAWEKMPGESDKDFRRRFSKRVVIIIDDIKIIQNSMDKILSVEDINQEHSNK